MGEPLVAGVANHAARAAIREVALPQGETPLIIAAHAGHITVVKLLLANGANPNVKDGSKRTALLHAKVRCLWHPLQGSPVRAHCLPELCCAAGPEALQHHGPARGGGGDSGECCGAVASFPE